MLITRIQIEGGFLDGFDLKLAPGLNVFIGARGTGKTSVIELIRYALGARSHTTDAKNRSLDHARAVLEDGEVSVTLQDLFHSLTVSRASDDDAPRSPSSFESPIVLSQTEIETLGLSDSGRLSLLDGFLTDRTTLRSEEAAAISAIRSVYKEIGALEAEISGLNDGVDQLQAMVEKLKELEKQQVLIQGTSVATAEKQKRLNQLSSETANLAVKEELLARFEENTEALASEIDQLLTANFGPDEWDGDPDHDPLKDLRSPYRQAINELEGVSGSFSSLQASAEERRQVFQTNRAELEREARTIRQELEKSAEGAGVLAREVNVIQARIAQLQARGKLLSERSARLAALRLRRDKHFSELANVRERRSDLREKAATNISCALAPHVLIKLERSAQYGEYTKAIANALRGSGMKYNDLAISLSENISPGELIKFVESDDFRGLADIVEIPNERAARLLGHLREFGIADIVTCDIEDNVRMSLLDGLEYKDIAALSAGQRCTVVLSVVLQHKERTLVIDQPEDHLDNAFVASTVIKSLKDRKNIGQVILSTHNANIPVLGNADLVIELTSDGRNGFIQVSQPLEHPDAVDAITSVMEGGREAFEDRAKFYKAYGK